jgi:hypothetical protein
MKKRIGIVPTKCKRCGRKIYTANRSIHGLDKLKEALGSICSNCATDEEIGEIQDAILTNFRLRR